MSHSIIIPACNEALRIEASFDRSTTHLDTQPFKSEVLVVADGGMLNAGHYEWTGH